MKKSLKIILTIGIIIFLMEVILVCFVVRDLKEERKLYEEIELIDSNLEYENYNSKEVNRLLQRTVTKYDYVYVEKAFKNYVQDIFKELNNIEATISDKKLGTLLTLKNYKEDGPKFKKTKLYLDEVYQKILKSKQNINNLMSEKTAVSYIEKQIDDEYYIDLFKQIAFEEGRMSAFEKQEINNSIDSLTSIVSIEADVIKFLSKNEGKWQVTNSNILFENEALLNEYNGYLIKLIQKTK